MRIYVNYHSVLALYDTEEDRFICAHADAEVRPPCCGSIGESGHIECGCHGMTQVYCYDCKNEDMDSEKVIELISSRLEAV